MQRTVLTSATMIDGNVTDVAVAGGEVVEVGPGLDRRGADRVDLEGFVLLPAAVEPHAHLDKAFLAESIHNPTGDLLGAIEAMKSNRHLLGVEETADRAERAARLMARNGYVAVRTHVDTTTEHGLTSVLALDEVRRRVAGVIDVEIVALAGWPITGHAGADARALLRDALQAGADLVGGCPHLEVHTGEGSIESATDELLTIAEEFGRPVDLHTDETLDPSADGLAVLARRVLEGFDRGATASHCVSLGQQSEHDQQRTAEMVADAGVGVVALPQTNLYLQGRAHSPMPRGLTAVGVLRDAGVTVSAGADNLQDPFNPVGRACPFEIAGLMILTSHDLPAQAWSAVSEAPASTLGRVPGALVPGGRADLVAVRAATLREAIAMGPGERLVWRDGVLLDPAA